MTKLSTANLLSIHVLILRIFVFGGATRIVGAGSRQSQIGLSKGVLSANPLPGASGLGKLTTFFLINRIKRDLSSMAAGRHSLGTIVGWIEVTREAERGGGRGHERSRARG